MTMSELTPGTRIARYRVVRRIGEGGMATIYLAASVGPGGFEKPCALKILRSDFSESGEVANMLLHEARFAALLHHPNIVQVFDLGKQGNEYYMVMEWVDGLSLAKLLSRISRAKQLLSIDVAAHVGISVAWAIDYLRRGVEYEGQVLSLIHRDVSPSNVLLSLEGTAKLTDFGIVKVLEAPATTRVGVVKGKYAYMSPEQIRGEPIDHRSDVFSLGVVMFEMLTNRRLFSRKTIAATVAAIHAARVVPPSSLNQDVPAELDQIVIKALSRRKEDRFQHAEDLVRALEPFSTAAAHRTLAHLVATHRDAVVPAGIDAAPSKDGVVSLLDEPGPREALSDEFDELEDFNRDSPLEDVDDEEATRLTPSQSFSFHAPAVRSVAGVGGMSAGSSIASRMSSVDAVEPDTLPQSWIWMAVGLFAVTVVCTVAFWAWFGGL